MYKEHFLNFHCKIGLFSSDQLQFSHKLFSTSSSELIPCNFKKKSSPSVEFKKKKKSLPFQRVAAILAFRTARAYELFSLFLDVHFPKWVRTELFSPPHHVRAISQRACCIRRSRISARDSNFVLKNRATTSNQR